jgi:hypothetical protein
MNLKVDGGSANMWLLYTLGVCFAALFVASTTKSTFAAGLVEWQPLPGMTSARLAASGWRQTGAAGLSWPDGRQAVVSYWESTIDNQRTTFTFRCVSYFDADLHQSGDGCSQAVHSDQPVSQP